MCGPGPRTAEACAATGATAPPNTPAPSATEARGRRSARQPVLRRRAVNTSRCTAQRHVARLIEHSVQVTVHRWPAVSDKAPRPCRCASPGRRDPGTEPSSVG
eukprot:scaffold4868_cov416-Prasinococcus_capsulatus_cf.AAC.1